MNKQLGFEIADKERGFLHCILEVAGDVNGDGKLTQSEFMQAAARRAASANKLMSRRASSSLRAITRKARNVKRVRVGDKHETEKSVRS